MAGETGEPRRGSARRGVRKRQAISRSVGGLEAPPSLPALSGVRGPLVEAPRLHRSKAPEDRRGRGSLAPVAREALEGAEAGLRAELAAHDRKRWTRSSFIARPPRKRAPRGARRPPAAGACRRCRAAASRPGAPPCPRRGRSPRRSARPTSAASAARARHGFGATAPRTPRRACTLRPAPARRATATSTSGQSYDSFCACLHVGGCGAGRRRRAGRCR